MDLGNIVIGDELFIDAETFFNQDFASNPGFFAFPTSVKKSSFEMYSMPNSEYQIELPQGCDSVTAVTKHGALLTFKDKLAFYSFKEREITNSFRLPPNTKCRGQLVISKISSLLTVCRKSISLKTSKIYLLTVGISKKNLGLMQLVKKPLVTSSGHYRSSFIARLQQNFKNIAIFWNRPNIFEQDKVNRFFNNVFYMIDLDLMKTSELPIDFSGINEPFATITFARMKKIEVNSGIYYVVVLRGFA
jgi:WD40 repeat protein